MACSICGKSITYGEPFLDDEDVTGRSFVHDHCLLIRKKTRKIEYLTELLSRVCSLAQAQHDVQAELDVCGKTLYTIACFAEIMDEANSEIERLHSLVQGTTDPCAIGAEILESLVEDEEDVSDIVPD